MSARFGATSIGCASSGYRVDAVRGRFGGYRLEAGGQLPPLLLTDDEAVTMAIGLRVAAQSGLADGELTTERALAKFEQVLPDALRRRVNAVATTVQAPTPRRAPVTHELLGALALACRDLERIRFSYRDGRDEVTDRIVEPHRLVAASGSWLLVAYDLMRDDWRTFRVDRMSRLFGTRLRFAPREPPGGASAYVAASMAALRRTTRLDVILELPLEQTRAAFGPWGSQVQAIDATTTRWRVEAESPEHAFGALAWIPAGVSYRLEGEQELLAFIRTAASRAAIAAEMVGVAASAG